MTRLWLLTACLCLTFGCQRGPERSANRPTDDASNATPDSEEQLPNSFKGYELYAWQEDYELVFTLITGTNRPKTADEVRSGESSEGGLIVVHGRGMASLQSTLARVRADDSVVLSELTPALPALPDNLRQEILASIDAR